MVLRFQRENRQKVKSCARELLEGFKAQVTIHKRHKTWQAKRFCPRIGQIFRSDYV